MKSKIKILLMLSAFVLNFAHDLLLHDLHSENSFHHSHNKSKQHFHDINAKCDYSENETSEKPYPQCHFEHSHDNVIIKNIKSANQNSTIVNLIESKYLLNRPQNYLIDFSRNFDDNLLIDFHSSSLSLRAPPIFA